MSACRSTIVILSMVMGLVVGGGSLWVSTAAAQSGGSTSEAARRIQAAMQSEIRTADEKARDANRKPLETLAFFGLREDHAVLELVPAGGWYTKILAPVLKENGKLYVALLVDGVKELKQQHSELADIEILEAGADWMQRGDVDPSTLGDTSFGIDEVDMVLTFRNMHNFSPAMRAVMNKASFDVLKPGGTYGIVDHTRRHMEATTRVNGRRMDPVLIIKEVLDAGFVFEDFATLHHRPIDDLTVEVGHPDVAGQTDRFTLRFRKPEDTVAQAQPAEHGIASRATQDKLRALIETDARPGNQRERDGYRHPFETLTFFGVDPESTVAEIWPGGPGGYYRRILEPLMLQGGGRYIAVEGNSPFPDAVPEVPYGELDMVLVFRAHGFMINEPPAQRYVDALYAMLKPGGVLGIVDHKGDESVPQDPKGENGYVNESHFRAMAEQAGFELVATSDVNRNPKDTKDHARGVYSLPPTLEGTLPFTSARQRVLDIGESDRFTLKFVKPAD